MVEFVTDRTEAHVNRLKALAAKGWNNMSTSERSEWLGETGDTWKGAYNYADMNRVETAVKEVSDRLQLGLTTKTNWTAQDVPTSDDIDRYMANVQVLRENYQGEEEIPEMPTLGRGFTYAVANTIERIVELSYEIPVEFHVVEDGKFVIEGAMSATSTDDGLYLDCTPPVNPPVVDPPEIEQPEEDIPENWDVPVLDGTTLTVTQVWSATQNGTILEVE